MTSQLDVINRALQKLGKSRIASVTDQSGNAAETVFAWTSLLRAELRRNVWRFAIRTIAIRALNPDMQKITFGTFAAGTTYAQNDVVVGSDGLIYVALVGANTGHDPTTTVGTWWTLYFGTLIAVPFIRAWSSLVTYSANDIVQENSIQYKSIAGGNLNHDPASDGGVHWSTDTNGNAATGISYFAGEIVFTSGSVYLSLVSGNTTDPTTDTTGSWMTFATAPTLAKMNFIYPIGSGPDGDASSRNVFMLPNGYVRQAAQDPTSQHNAFLGGPTGRSAKDWNFENQCFTSADGGPILFRFAASVADASQFDPLFVEGFACRLAMESCETLTGSTDKLKLLMVEYKKFMGDARTVNGIEKGPEDPDLDDYLAVRV